MDEERKAAIPMEEEVTHVPLPPANSQQKTITQIPKSIVLNPIRRKIVDPQVVAFPYYNSFNYSLLSKEENNKEVQLALGITSANSGEGKSLVASNLAVSLTLGYRKKTILVDLNMQHPTLHDVFGAPQGPGLLEALNSGNIHVWQTAVDHLHLLSAGHSNGRRSHHPLNFSGSQQLRLDQMTAFSEVISALQQDYEFIIVDMPAMNSENFPVLFANRLDGVLVVVDSTSTRRHDVEKVFRRLNERQVLGFILNRVKDEQE